MATFVSTTFGESGGCLGNCASYEATVDADGAVQFYGHEFAQAQAQAKLPNQALFAIATAFKQYRFAEMQDRYEPGGSECSDFDSDSTTVTIRLKLTTGEKSVSYYLGCHNSTRARLLALLDALKNSVGIKQWLRESRDA